MNKKLDRKKQKQVHRYVRAIIQLIFFLLVPSAFTAAFSGVKYLFTQIGKGDAIGMTSFVTALCVLCLYTILFGRFFCGFACAFGSFGDALHGIYLWICKKIRKKPYRISEKITKYLYLLKYIVLAMISLLCYAGVYAKTKGISPWEVFSMIRAGNFKLGGYAIGIVLLTILMMVGISLLKIDYGPMARYERNAMESGDLFSGKNPYDTMEVEEDVSHGRVMDLVLPIVLLILCCVTGMLYSGGFFDGVGFVEAFSASDASVGLLLGSAFALVFSLIYFGLRRSMSFSSMMSCIPEGFKAMVPAILILSFAWTLKAMTDSLGAKYFVRDFVYSNASQVQMFLPAIVFLIGCLLAFATGTSWGTFGMLIPIVQSVFPMDNPLSVVCISACMAGAVCGDHCSPISDTTIMASAGAQCDHVNHVSTQLPYAITVAAVSFVSYVIAGFLPKAWIALPIAIVLMLLTLFGIHMVHKRNKTVVSSSK